MDILYELQIRPDFIIGHSIGELACAYADETLTLEQTVLATYWRGKSLLMTELETGSMAAIGVYICIDLYKMADVQSPAGATRVQTPPILSQKPQFLFVWENHKKFCLLCSLPTILG